MHKTNQVIALGKVTVSVSRFFLLEILVFEVIMHKVLVADEKKTSPF